MVTNKLKAIGLGVAALLLAAGAGAAIVYFIAHNNEDPMVAAAKAQMASMPSRPAGASNFVRPQYTYTGAAIKGIVRTPDGKPVAGADIIVQNRFRATMLSLSAEAVGSPTTQSGADGHFEVTPTEQPGAIIIRSPQGIAFTSASLLSASKDVVLRPWGRIDGTARVGSPSGIGRARVELAMTTGDPRGGPGFLTMQRTLLTVDQSGHFTLDQVAPGRVGIGVTLPGQVRPQRHQELDVSSGATASIAIGGNGRPVIGRLVPAVVSTSRGLTLVPSVANPLRGRDLSMMSAVEQQEMTNSPEYRAWLDAHRSAFNVMLDNDGSFRIDDVPAGKYTLEARYYYRDRQRQMGGPMPPAGRPMPPERVASVDKEITVAVASDGQSDLPLDLGNIQLQILSDLALAKPAPELSCVDSDGKPVNVADFRGKYLLFSLIDGENPRDWIDIARCAAIFDRFGTNPRLAMLVIHTGDDFDAAKKKADVLRVQWPMVHVQKSASELPEQYRKANQKIFLVDPEGNLVSRGGDPFDIYRMIESDLAKSTTRPRSDAINTTDQVPPRSR